MVLGAELQLWKIDNIAGCRVLVREDDNGADG